MYWDDNKKVRRWCYVHYADWLFVIIVPFWMAPFEVNFIRISDLHLWDNWKPVVRPLIFVTSLHAHAKQCTCVINTRIGWNSIIGTCMWLRVPRHPIILQQLKIELWPLSCPLQFLSSNSNWLSFQHLWLIASFTSQCLVLLLYCALPAAKLHINPAHTAWIVYYIKSSTTLCTCPQKLIGQGRPTSVSVVHLCENSSGFYIAVKLK